MLIFINVILVNLTIGLSVSDVQALIDNAELEKIKTQVDFLCWLSHYDIIRLILYNRHKKSNKKELITKTTFVYVYFFKKYYL